MKVKSGKGKLCKSDLTGPTGHIEGSRLYPDSNDFQQIHALTFHSGPCKEKNLAKGRNLKAKRHIREAAAII